MKRFFREYFTFTSSERNGILMLLGILFLLIIYIRLVPLFYSPVKTDFSSFEKEIVAFEEQNKQLPKYQDVAATEEIPDPPTSPERFYFNPNGLGEKDWKRLGLTDKQISIIKNYEEKGGRFYKKEDVQKMYCISPELYQSLAPYIVFEQPAFEKKNIPPTTMPRQLSEEQPLLELNTADSSTLVTLKGIGPAFAWRIISYRESLGGFIDKNQLFEVFGMDSARFHLFAGRVAVNPSFIRPLHINTGVAASFKSHPYIRKWNIANAIVNYRTAHGAFKTLDDLKKINLVSDSLYQKILPYLRLE